MELAGVAIWALDFDDFNGQFSGGQSYLMLTVLNRALKQDLDDDDETQSKHFQSTARAKDRAARKDKPSNGYSVAKASREPHGHRSQPGFSETDQSGLVALHFQQLGILGDDEDADEL